MLNYNPFYENLKLKIKKDNDKVYMYLDNKLLMQRYLPNNIENFNIGYYSAAGNIIKNIKISSNIPNGWNINMNNTNGGYINFNYNSFTITECSDLAEVEQSNIFLKANDKSNKCYYLKYEVENINNENDIKAYVSLSKDDRYDDEKKNILNNNKFILKEDDYINLKFKGTIGTIKNIQITNKKEDTYISTEYNQGETNASFIKINTSELEKIEFKGYINSIPKRNIIFEEINYAIIEDYKKKPGNNSAFSLDYVVINDGSSDSTEKICLQNGIPVISLANNLGIGGAVQTGYKYAYLMGYDVAVQFDGDGQHDIDSLEKLVVPVLIGVFIFMNILGSREAKAK